MPGLSGFFERKNMSFNPDNPRRKALIAMSGGVDSSVAAYLAIESGLDCIGVTMKLFDNEDAGISREKELLLARRYGVCARRRLQARDAVLCL